MKINSVQPWVLRLNSCISTTQIKPSKCSGRELLLSLKRLIVPVQGPKLGVQEKNVNNYD
jgi:hypothetical protein